MSSYDVMSLPVFLRCFAAGPPERGRLEVRTRSASPVRERYSRITGRYLSRSKEGGYRVSAASAPHRWRGRPHPTVAVLFRVPGPASVSTLPFTAHTSDGLTDDQCHRDSFITGRVVCQADFIDCLATKTLLRQWASERKPRRHPSAPLRAGKERKQTMPLYGSLRVSACPE